MTNPSPDLLEEFEIHLQKASTGKRLANYLIDLVTFYIFFFTIGVVMIPGTMVAGEATTYTRSFSFFDRLLMLLLYGIFMFIVEIIFKGKSLGKLITGTRAVNEDGSPLTAKSALLRGLSRAVPFDQFSALGSPSYPWHDRWSHTIVIDEKQSRV